jgi:cytochrome b6-f complex iron-sulfur subunit
MAASSQQNGDNRRDFLARAFRWTSALICTALAWPLLRFLGFTVKPRPRYVKVAAPLPASGFHQEREFILFGDGTTARAVSRTCTHLGCRVNYLEDRKIIECPCHQSRFSPEGQVLNGPAKKNLPAFAVEVQTDAAGEVTGYVVTL